MAIKHLKRLGSDALIYGLSSSILRLISLFLTPIYTNYVFEPKDYGIMSLLSSTGALVSMVLVFAMDSSASVYFYDMNNDEDRKRPFATWFWFQLTLASVTGLVCFLFAGKIASFLLGEQGDPRYIQIAAVSLIVGVLPNIVINWFRVQQKAKFSVLFSVTYSLFTIGSTCIFLLVLKLGLIGSLLGTFVSATLYSLIAVYCLRNAIGLKYFDLALLKKMLRFSYPLIPAAISYWLLNTTDSYFIAYYRNESEVGLFSIGASIAAVLTLFTGAFQNAWGPFAMSISKEPEAQQTYANVFLLYTYIFGILGVGVLLFAPEALMILTAPKYYGASWVAGILAFNIIIIGYQYIANIGPSIMRTSVVFGKAMLLAAVLTVILNVLLIPPFGKEGSAIATILAQAVVPFYVFQQSQKIYFIPYNFKKALFALSLFIGLGVGVRLIQFDNIVIQVTVKIITVLILFASVYLANKEQILRIINSRKKIKETI